MSNRCAIYSRCSTPDQTVENQIRELKEIAERKSLLVVSQFSDEAISGAKGRDQRKGFDQLIKGAVRKDFDLILVWSVDRLGRSLQDLVSFLNEIHSVDCDLYIHQSGIEYTNCQSGRQPGTIAPLPTHPRGQYSRPHGRQYIRIGIHCAHHRP